MKVRLTVLTICLAGPLFLFSLPRICLSSKPVPPPSLEKIVGTWLGFQEDMLVFYRVELKADGKGIAATTYLDEPAKLYKVERWSLDGFNVEVSLSPLDEDGYPLNMKGLTDPLIMVLEVGGVGKAWKRKAKLFSEGNFLAKSRRVQERMERFKSMEKREPNKR